MKTDADKTHNTDKEPAWKLHECEQLPRAGVRIVFSMDNINRKTKTWHLIIRRKATYKDLMENHIFEVEGQIIWETHIEIAHCPYCGQKLFDLNESVLNDYGQFYHIDHSQWHSKYQ